VLGALPLAVNAVNENPSLLPGNFILTTLIKTPRIQTAEEMIQEVRDKEHGGLLVAATGGSH